MRKQWIRVIWGFLIVNTIITPAFSATADVEWQSFVQAMKTRNPAIVLPATYPNGTFNFQYNSLTIPASVIQDSVTQKLNVTIPQIQMNDLKQLLQQNQLDNWFPTNFQGELKTLLSNLTSLSNLNLPYSSADQQFKTMRFSYSVSAAQLQSFPAEIRAMLPAGLSIEVEIQDILTGTPKIKVIRVPKVAQLNIDILKKLGLDPASIKQKLGLSDNDLAQKFKWDFGYNPDTYEFNGITIHSEFPNPISICETQLQSGSSALMQFRNIILNTTISKQGVFTGSVTGELKFNQSEFKQGSIEITATDAIIKSSGSEFTITANDIKALIGEAQYNACFSYFEGSIVMSDPIITFDRTNFTKPKSVTGKFRPGADARLKDGSSFNSEQNFNWLNPFKDPLLPNFNIKIGIDGGGLIDLTTLPLPKDLATGKLIYAPDVTKTPSQGFGLVRIGTTNFYLDFSAELDSIITEMFNSANISLGGIKPSDIYKGTVSTDRFIAWLGESVAKDVLVACGVPSDVATSMITLSKSNDKSEAAMALLRDWALKFMIEKFAGLANPIPISQIQMLVSAGQMSTNLINFYNSNRTMILAGIKAIAVQTITQYVEKAGTYPIKDLSDYDLYNAAYNGVYLEKCRKWNCFSGGNDRIAYLYELSIRHKNEFGVLARAQIQREYNQYRRDNLLKGLKTRYLFLALWFEEYNLRAGVYDEYSSDYHQKYNEVDASHTVGDQIVFDYSNESIALSFWGIIYQGVIIEEIIRELDAACVNNALLQTEELQYYQANGLDTTALKQLHNDEKKFYYSFFSPLEQAKTFWNYKCFANKDERQINLFEYEALFVNKPYMLKFTFPNGKYVTRQIDFPNEASIHFKFNCPSYLSGGDQIKIDILKTKTWYYSTEDRINDASTLYDSFPLTSIPLEISPVYPQLITIHSSNGFFTTKVKRIVESHNGIMNFNYLVDLSLQNTDVVNRTILNGQSEQYIGRIQSTVQNVTVESGGTLNVKSGQKIVVKPNTKFKPGSKVNLKIDPSLSPL